MTRAPQREVTRVIEVEGERGGVQLVHVMTCGHWMIRRGRPRATLACVGCVVQAAMARSSEGR